MQRPTFQPAFPCFGLKTRSVRVNRGAASSPITSFNLADVSHPDPSCPTCNSQRYWLSGSYLEHVPPISSQYVTMLGSLSLSEFLGKTPVFDARTCLVGKQPHHSRSAGEHFGFKALRCCQSILDQVYAVLFQFFATGFVDVVGTSYRPHLFHPLRGGDQCRALQFR